jgi:hypothetical protein
MRGKYWISIYLTNPGRNVWVEIPNSVMISVSGHPTVTGQVFKYYEGNGWVFLDEKLGK